MPLEFAPAHRAVAPAEQLAGVNPSYTGNLGGDCARLHRRCNNPRQLTSARRPSPGAYQETNLLTMRPTGTLEANRLKLKLNLEPCSKHHPNELTAPGCGAHDALIDLIVVPVKELCRR